MNGPQNLGGVRQSALIHIIETDQFVLDTAFIAPDVIERIERLVVELTLTEKQAAEEFLMATAEIDKQIKMPRKSNDAWEILLRKFSFDPKA